MKRLSALTVIFMMTLTAGWSQNNRYVSVFGENTNDGLTQVSPVRDVQHAINISQEGDTINIYGGEYYEYLNITHNNLTIKQASIFDEVVIKPSMGNIVENALLLIDSKSNILIDGITFAEHMVNYAQGIYVRGGGSNIDIINCRVHDIHFSDDPNSAVNENTNAQAIIVEGTEELSNVNIIGCEVYNCRLGYSEGIAINGNVTYFNVSENYVHDLTNIGIVAIGHEGVCKTAEMEPIKHSVYPNPFIDELNIVSEETITSYAIYDAMGRRVVYKEGLEVNNLKVDTSRLRVGVYTLVVNGRGSLVVRF